MSRVVDNPTVLGRRLFPLDCESDKTNVTLQTWSVCLLDSHSFPKRQEQVPLFTYRLCQESGISPALRGSTNDQEIFWVDEHSGKCRGENGEEKTWKSKKISPLITPWLSSPSGHSSRDLSFCNVLVSWQGDHLSRSPLEVFLCLISQDWVIFIKSAYLPVSPNHCI